jgi:hypothetical protein
MMSAESENKQEMFKQEEEMMSTEHEMMPNSQEQPEIKQQWETEQFEQLETKQQSEIDPLETKQEQQMRLEHETYATKPTCKDLDRQWQQAKKALQRNKEVIDAQKKSKKI